MRTSTLICSCALCALLTTSLLPASSEEFHFDFSEITPSETEAAVHTREVRLCYSSNDASEFTYITRTLNAETIEELIREMLKELTDHSYTDGTGLFQITTYVGFELSCGTLTINLPIGTFANLTEQEILFGCSALANSFLDLEEIDAVNILHDSHSFSISGLPIGVFTKQIDSGTLLYGSFESGHNNYTDGTYATRSILLYYPSADGSCYLPVVRDIPVSTVDSFMSVAEPLTTITPEELDLIKALPACENLLAETPQVRHTESGECIVEISFDSVLPDYLALSGMEPGTYFGSLALSTMSFLPNIDKVRIIVGSEPITQIELPNTVSINCVDGKLDRGYLSSCIGSVEDLYLPDDSGQMIRKKVITGRRECTTLAGLLRKLFNTYRADNCASILPEGISGSDILSIDIQGTTAVINMTSNFYTLCQSLNEEEERLLAYSMINTLCTKTGINSVRFTIEGNNMDLFVHSICLSSELLPDPGLIIQEGDAHP